MGRGSPWWVGETAVQLAWMQRMRLIHRVRRRVGTWLMPHQRHGYVLLVSSFLEKVAGRLTNVLDSRIVDSLEDQVGRTSSLMCGYRGQP
jgi:hypothetical protein